MSSILEVVEVVVEGRRVSAFEKGVALRLIPVHRLLRSEGAVPWRCDRVVIKLTTHAPPRQARGCKFLGARAARDLAPVTVHEDLFRARVGCVNPVERADAASFGARRHVGGDSEISPAIPDTRMVRAEDDKVLWLDGVDVGVVSDAECTAASVCFVVSVEGGSGTAWAWVVSGLNITAWRRGVVCCRAFVAGNLSVVDSAGREFHELAILGRIVEMVVKPPLVEAVFHQGHDRSVVVVEGASGDVEAPHSLIPDTLWFFHQTYLGETKRKGLHAWPATRDTEAARTAAETTERRNIFIYLTYRLSTSGFEMRSGKGRRVRKAGRASKLLERSVMVRRSGGSPSSASSTARRIGEREK